MAHTSDPRFTHYTSKDELLKNLLELQSSDPELLEVIIRLNLTDAAQWADPTGTVVT